MEHPLIGKIDNLTIEQLTDNINKLYKKLAIAIRTNNNGYLCHQIRMAIESYTNKLKELQAKAWEESTQNFKDKINIS